MSLTLYLIIPTLNKLETLALFLLGAFNFLFEVERTWKPNLQGDHSTPKPGNNPEMWKSDYNQSVTDY